jgi:hypothetical protein
LTYCAPAGPAPKAHATAKLKSAALSPFPIVLIGIAFLFSNNPPVPSWHWFLLIYQICGVRAMLFRRIGDASFQFSRLTKSYEEV